MNFSPETIGAAAELADAVRAGLALPLGSLDVEAASTRLWYAGVAAEDAGVDPVEIVVLTAAAGHPWSPQWAKEYILREGGRLDFVSRSE